MGLNKSNSTIMSRNWAYRGKNSQNLQNMAMGNRQNNNVRDMNIQIKQNNNVQNIGLVHSNTKSFP